MGKTAVVLGVGHECAQGRQGWEKRRQPDYQPNEKQRQYQQAYYQRKKAARQQPAREPAEKDERQWHEEA